MTVVFESANHFCTSSRQPNMRARRRRLLGVVVATLSRGGCLHNPGRSCDGATVRLSLSPTGSVTDPLDLGSRGLSPEANAVVETAIEGTHVEHCVTWAPNADETGPSPGLKEVGNRIASHAGIELTGRVDDVAIDAIRDGDRYRLEFETRR
jgi:hypothetical protein